MNAPRLRKPRLLPAILAAGVLVAGVAVAQNSMAFWNDAETTAGLTVTTGTAELSIVAPTPASDRELSPGATVSYVDGSFAVDGDVPLAVTVARDSVDEFAAATKVRVGASTPGSACLPGVLVPLEGAVSILTHQPGAHYTLCASVELPLTATVGAGLTTSVTLTFSGTQS